MSQNITHNGEIKRTYWVNDLNNIHGPLVPVYDTDIGGVPNQIYLERTIATDLHMQDDDNFPIVNRVYGGPYPLIDRYVIPPHDPSVPEERIAPSIEPIENNSGAQTQDEYFEDIEKMLDEADRLISEIAGPANELDVAALITADEGDIPAEQILRDPTEDDDEQSSPDLLAEGDMDGQQPIERGFRCVTYNAQKSRKNVHFFLEKHMEDVDVVFIQEPPWRFMKKIPSSTNKEGDDYEHTVSH